MSKHYATLKPEYHAYDYDTHVTHKKGRLVSLAGTWWIEYPNGTRVNTNSASTGNGRWHRRLTEDSVFDNATFLDLAARWHFNSLMTNRTETKGRLAVVADTWVIAYASGARRDTMMPAIGRDRWNRERIENHVAAKV